MIDSDQPDPRIAAGARHHYSQGKTVYRTFTACDSGRRRQQALGHIASAAGVLQLEMQYLGRQIDESDKLILEIAKGMDSCRRLIAIPGIGPLTATATIAAIGNGAAFKKGREFAAWLGVVPGEQSTGGKQKLTGTSKRGNKVSAQTVRTGSAHGLTAKEQAIGWPEYAADPISLHANASR